MSSGFISHVIRCQMLHELDCHRYWVRADREALGRAMVRLAASQRTTRMRREAQLEQIQAQIAIWQMTLSPPVLGEKAWLLRTRKVRELTPAEDCLLYCARWYVRFFLALVGFVMPSRPIRACEVVRRQAQEERHQRLAEAETARDLLTYEMQQRTLTEAERGIAWEILQRQQNIREREAEIASLSRQLGLDPLSEEYSPEEANHVALKETRAVTLALSAHA